MYEPFISMIEHWGYSALFFIFCLGIIGIPIPNEIAVMFGGAASNHQLLEPVPAFIFMFLGMVSGLSIGYMAGRYLGNPFIEWLRRSKNMERSIGASEYLIHKYGVFVLCLSYFFPIIRHVLPYVVGSYKMSYRRFFLSAVPSALVWALLFFVIGHLAGNQVPQLGKLIYNNVLKITWLPTVVMIVIFIHHYAYAKNK